MPAIARSWVRSLPLVLLALVALVNSGCLALVAGAGAAGGAATYAYVKGSVTHDFPANFQDTWLALQDALRELQLPIDRQEPGTMQGMIESHTGDRTAIRIDLQTTPSPIPAEGVITKVSIRVGMFGDVPVSQRILERMSAHLVPRTTTAAAPTTATAPPLRLAPIQQTSAIRPGETPPPPLADKK